MSVYDGIHKRHKKFDMDQQISCSEMETGRRRVGYGYEVTGK